MAYVRQKGQQVVIVHGVREAGKVTQKVLFTFYSKAEAFRAIGKGHKNQKQMFQALLEEEYPNIRFNWETIHRSIADQLHILPDLADYRQQRLDTGFKESFFNFARQLIVNTPESKPTAGQIISTHRHSWNFSNQLST
ncbi:MAG: hypothetical protein ACOH5I_06345 [Oligoflexus sp.]